ncbi:KGK domain-containing protein [Allocoleopsis sp.]|uniref:KGK domain-containing protein n=1 Tax=Allocoleopsis sp. TaxID=3088169 RepID=UPI002FD2DEBD
MERKFQRLDDEHEDKDTVLGFPCSMLKVSDFMKAVKEGLQPVGLDQLRNILNKRGGIPGNFDQWYEQGVNLEFLKPGAKGWKTGKLRIRITLELLPDEPETEEIPASNELGASKLESPLDDLRQMMPKDS